MEITITKKVDIVETVEIKLPAYYKTIAHQFKIISEQHCICVTLGVSKVQIETAHAELPFNVNATESTETEFNDAFMKVMSELKYLIK